CSTSIAHPRIVRIAVLRSRVISMEMAPDTANRFLRHSFRLLAHGWDSQWRELKVCCDTAREPARKSIALN
ncbi:hypothetical protein, partial [Escherichia fergusonii]|uniref:hypothetical protein n=1 Tax=Escherichia fergusonii TaxID=564 RepID=UPI001C5CBF94